MNPPRPLRAVAAGLCISCWLIVSLFLYFGLQLLTVDEEWEGWWDVWPVLVVYGLGTAGAAVVVTLLLRTRI